MGSFAPLAWDETGKKLFETGVSNVALYPQDTTGVYGAGVAWNGVTNISESPSGAEATTLWANNGKYLNLYSVEEYASSIEAYTYPDEFAECDGSAEIAKGVSIGQQTDRIESGDAVITLFLLDILRLDLLEMTERTYIRQQHQCK